MKAVIDVVCNDKLKTSDVLVYKNGKWTNMSKTQFLSEIMTEQKHLKESNEMFKQEIEQDLDEFKEKINAKLKAFHEVLQTLVNK